jgi:hypothetical protein
MKDWIDMLKKPKPNGKFFTVSRSGLYNFKAFGLFWGV